MSSTPTPAELRDPATATLVRVCDLQAEQRHVRKDVERLNRAVIGNGTLGLCVRVDRLERVERNRTWVVRVIWAAILIVVATAGVRFVASLVADDPSTVTVKTPEVMP